eukprot:g4268.t1
MVFLPADPLLGGSSSRSDGLGGTVNSRLNKNVASNEWVQSVAAFSASYSDAGILGAYGAVNLEDAARFRDAVTAELESIASSGVSAEETARAAAKAKMAVATSCDSNAGLVQVSATLRAGKRNCEIDFMDCRFAHL